MSEPAPEERAETIVTWILTDQAVRCLPLKTQEVIATEIRAAILAERERCVRKMRERCTYCDDGVVTFTARVPDPRNPYSETPLPELQQERCQACGEQEAAMREET
jgi:hypothetical protein